MRPLYITHPSPSHNLTLRECHMPVIFTSIQMKSIIKSKLISYKIIKFKDNGSKN